MSLTDILFISFGISPLKQQGTINMNTIQINRIQDFGGTGYVLFSNKISFGKQHLVYGLRSNARLSINPWPNENIIVKEYFSDRNSKILNYYQYSDLNKDYQVLLNLCKEITDYDSFLVNKSQLEHEISEIKNTSIQNNIFKEYKKLIKYCEFLTS